MILYDYSKVPTTTEARMKVSNIVGVILSNLLFIDILKVVVYWIASMVMQITLLSRFIKFKASFIFLLLNDTFNHLGYVVSNGKMAVCIMKESERKWSWTITIKCLKTISLT
jgi:hypothetical protein